MNKLLLFAGTTEGREMAAWLDRQGVSAHVCVATEYGEALLMPEAGRHCIHRGRLTCDEMAELMRREGITHVVDATHPYAVDVSLNIKKACEETGCIRYRLSRESSDPAGYPGKGSGRLIRVSSIEEAVNALEHTQGNILVSTGAKELGKYTALTGWQDRVYARILSSRESLTAAEELGFPGSHLICMQGPFSEELNTAMLRAVSARYFVTKESGTAGGFPEKSRAAAKAGAVLVVVSRPSSSEPEQGLSEYEIRRLLCRELPVSVKQKVALIGIGMGDPMNMTREAWEACRSADVRIGAERVLASVSGIPGPSFVEYRGEEIRKYLKEHPEYESAAVLVSGDTGFFSGAKNTVKLFGNDNVQVFAGVSSAAYLCTRLGESWEDARLMSIHGRRMNISAAVRTNRKVIVLTGKPDTFRDMCRDLIRSGLEHVRISAGMDLSYENEKILTGTPETMMDADVSGLCTALIINDSPRADLSGGIADEMFVRGNLPMTKAEVRCISVSKLHLLPDSICYDIGCGTGSVSVEMAIHCPEGKVYAVDRNPEALLLTGQNAERFGLVNIETVQGTAPDVLEQLPAPTHAFIGGTAGNMESIIELLLKKNRNVRIVINAIALETVAEAVRVLRRLSLPGQETVCVNIARAREMGPYHLMTGMNPVYVISCGGEEQ